MLIPFHPLQIAPGIPDVLLETIMVEIAHFEPTPVLLSMEGVYPSISLGLPRVPEGLYSSCLEQAQAAAAIRKAAKAEAASKMPPATAAVPSVPASGRSSPTKALPAGSRPSTSSSMKPPPSALHKKTIAEPAAPSHPERKPDAEAERLRLVKLLVDKEAALRPSSALAIVAIPEEGDVLFGTNGVSENDLLEDPDQLLPVVVTQAAATAKVRPSPSPAPTSGPKREKGAIQPPIPSIFAANYIVDFGYVTKGTTRNRKFRMTNPGSQAVTLKFEKVCHALTFHTSFSMGYENSALIIISSCIPCLLIAAIPHYVNLCMFEGAP